uniref:Uncharacterized protein n=1 Tax=Timema shepardi TaxID=629360 RepID=A0A7R9G1M7_TIMSH|nr:unnamed protein product [Timema shepardi]
MAVHRGCANLCEADALFECESCTLTSYEDAAVGDQAGTSKNKIHGSAKRGKKKRGVSWKNGISTKIKKKEYQQGNNRIEEPAALMVQEESSRSHSDDDDDDEDVIEIVLCGSHSFLRSSDRVKSRPHLTYYSHLSCVHICDMGACEIMPVIQNVHSLASGASPWNTQPTSPAPQQQLWNSDFSEARPWVGPSAYKQPPVETTKLQQNVDPSGSLKTSIDLLFHMGDTSSPLQRISLKPGTNMVDIMRGLRCCVVDGNGVIIQSDALLTPQEVMSSDSTNTTAFSQLSSGCNNDDSSFVVLKQPTMAQSETTSTQDNQQWVNSSLVTLAPSHPGLPNYSDQSLHFHSTAKKGPTSPSPHHAIYHIRIGTASRTFNAMSWRALPYQVVNTSNM